MQTSFNAIMVVMVDRAKLLEAGKKLVVTCEACHADYKPTSPTEGILHVPHHEYGDPLARG